MRIGFLLFLVAAAATLADGQRHTGFISIDCGSPPNFQYQDTDTGISYVSDQGYIESGIGINRNISSEYAYPINPNLPLPLSDLRSFPHGINNCYSLKPSSGDNGFVGTSLNLIRASFLYGNYDGLNHLPQFDLYLGVNLWTTIKFQSASHIVTTEIITSWPISPHTNTIHVCLINKGLGTPFISALELRPLNSSIYNAAATTVPSYSYSLLLFQRLDIGQSNNGTSTGIQYEDDIYDRTWSSYNMISTAWDTLITSQPIINFENGYRVPYQVIRSAAKPRNINNATTLELNWSSASASNSDDDEFYIYMYFAEVEQLGRNQSRKFNVSWNGNPLFGPFSPHYLYATVLSNSRALVGKQHRISIYKIEDSTHPPILNALEIYMLKHMDQLPTYTQDVDAIMDVKTTYQINKNWGGDPCGPKHLSWQGLKCSYNNNASNASFPRIVSLNLTWSNLSGTIAASIANLSLLESLDLSNNNLTGSVPGFLEDLKSLKFMNLKGNQLSGSVPSALLRRSEAGLLTLSVDGRNLCGSGSCKRKKNIAVPIVASLMSSAVVVLTVVVIIVWKMRRERKSKAEIYNNTGNKTVALKKLQYSHTEVLKITNNFQRVIGKGGFGTVYHGYLKDGNQVAVKMLSPSSSQGPKEFKTEAELLMRVHHRNLASFVGYCDDADHLALIYEYMPNGNLKDYLSDTSLHLNWETRLHIAIDAAQGLEYLHHGCKPPIVHRDVKTANILLTKNLNAKIADFGLSKVFPSDHDSAHTNTTPVLMETSVMGTAGYLDPQYYKSHMLNEKSDVYSFGVVLLELITGQTAVIKSEERMHIIHWLVPELQRGDIRRIVDKRLQLATADDHHDDDHEYHFEVKSVLKALQVAMACTTSTSHQRPTMGHVVAELKQCLDIIVMGSSTTRPPPPWSTTTTITEEMYMITSSYASSSDIAHDVYSTPNTDSINAESMTAPFAR